MSETVAWPTKALFYFIYATIYLVNSVSVLFSPTETAISKTKYTVWLERITSKSTEIMDRLQRKESTNKDAAWENAKRLQNIRELKKNGQLNIQAVIKLLWVMRDDKEIVANLSDLLTSEGSSKSVFDGIEFYLPQLVHMMIHLDDTWEFPVLEQFVYMVAQHSMHFALQLHWYVIGYMQEHKPEAEVGKKNKKSDDTLFKKAARIINNLEIVITYGNPDSVALEQRYHDKEINRDEFIEQKKQVRFDFAGVLADKDSKTIMSQAMEHRIRYTDRKEIVQPKFKDYIVEIKDQMLYLTDPRSKNEEKLVRGFSLKNAEITFDPNHKIKNYFEIKPDLDEPLVYCFRTPNETRRIKWMRLLKESANDPPMYNPEDDEEKEKIKLTEKQNSRFSFYRSEIQFVKGLTTVATRLNGYKEDRLKKMAIVNATKNLKIDEMNYNPLCRSSEPFTQIVKTIPEKSHAFSTKGHTPTLLAFKTKKLFEGQDVANVLNDEFSEEAVSGILDNLSHMLAPVASLFYGDDQAKNMLVTRPSLWEEDEEGIVSMSRTNLPLVPNELLLIAKHDETIRQEAFAMQLLWFMKDLWDNEVPELYLYPFHILPTSKDTGLIEFVPNCKSLDGLKKDYKRQEDRNVSLLEHFQSVFKKDLKMAKIRFAESLAAYSVASYVLGIKNRNNSNIMLTDEGRIVHVDFGYILGMAPGKGFSPEKAAFKLTKEMIEVLDGEDSDLFKEFVEMCVSGFQTLRSEQESLIELVSIIGHKSTMACFNQGGGSEKVIKDLQKRLMITMTYEEANIKFVSLISKSKNHVGTKMFDKYESVSRKISMVK
uniref:PI3K/PI4K catalytic domain-containing protein n=1 Tax=Aplanochytrium stocchinoi TaxID=215587 RepID=A0A7S3LJR1_9STRA